jgi:hypothetical protein
MLINYQYEVMSIGKHPTCVITDFFQCRRNKYSEWIKKYHSQDIFQVKFGKILST